MILFIIIIIKCYYFLKNFINLFLFLTALGLHCCMGFSLAAENGSCPAVTVCGLLIAVASHCGAQTLG